MKTCYCFLSTAESHYANTRIRLNQLFREQCHLRFGGRLLGLVRKFRLFPALSLHIFSQKATYGSLQCGLIVWLSTFFTLLRFLRELPRA